MPEDRARLRAGIRNALARIGGTQLDQAARIGVSVNTIKGWKAGAGSPSEENMARLARLANMTQEDIRNGGVDVAA